MRISYFFDKRDHINFLMFNTSNSENFTRKRLAVMFFCLAVLTVLFFMKKDYTYLFFAAGIIIIFFPYSKWIYKRNFKRYTDTRFKNDICWKGVLSLEENEITMVSEEGKVIWKYSKAKSLYETEKYYFLGSNNEEYIIMPKDKIDAGLLKNFIAEFKLKTSLAPVYVKKNWFS